MEATVTTATTRSECSQAADSIEQVRRQLGALSRRENTLLGPIIIRMPHECDITFSESGPAEVLGRSDETVWTGATGLEFIPAFIRDEITQETFKANKSQAGAFCPTEEAPPSQERQSVLESLN